MSEGVLGPLYEQSQRLVCQLVTRPLLPGEDGEGPCWLEAAPLLETGLVVYCLTGDPGLLEGVAKATDRLLGGRGADGPVRPAELAAALRLLTRLHQVGGQRRHRERAADLAGRLTALYDRRARRFRASGDAAGRAEVDSAGQTGPAVTLMAAAALLIAGAVGVAAEAETGLAALSLIPTREGSAVPPEAGGGEPGPDSSAPGLRATIADAVLQAYILTGRREHLRPIVGLLAAAESPDEGATATAPPPVAVDQAGLFRLADVGLAIGQIVGREGIERESRRLLERLAPIAVRELPAVSPLEPAPGLVRLLARLVPALARALTPPVEVILAGRSNEEDTRQLLQAAVRPFDPALVLITCDPTGDAARLERLGLPSLSRPAAYVCLQRECSSPINDPLELPKAIAETLRRRRAELAET